jgi:nitroreductase
LKEIFTRRSIRKFKDQAVEPEKIDRLLRAAMQAPSAANQQPWEFIVITEKEMLERLSLLSVYAKPIASSAVTILLVTNGDALKAPIEPTAWQQDMGAAAQNILLEAVYLGLGGVWLGVATTDNAIAYVRDVFKLPENIKPFALISIGYPDEQKNEFVDRYNSEKVHYEKWL